MNSEIWQQLLSLESRDITAEWFSRIHSRELNARRAKEINSAAKQAREYFKNADSSGHSVKPLLTFYGVASLSRALLLLLKKQGGEEGLTGSHGLETVDWGAVFSGEVANGLQKIGDLRIRTRTGLFTDFLTHTNNRISIHVNSSRVDWHICYDLPPIGTELTFDELLSRIPDLQTDYQNISVGKRYSSINEMTFSEENGFRAKTKKSDFDSFRSFYESAGFVISDETDWAILTADNKKFSENLPQFVHSYIHKTFGTIPALYLSEPFQGSARYSQLGIAYMVSYVLGMLVRYYPTHWVSLTQGDKGDTWWPTTNRAQHFVENSFPELVIELIGDILEKNEQLNSADGWKA